MMCQSEPTGASRRTDAPDHLNVRQLSVRYPWTTLARVLAPLGSVRGRRLLVSVFGSAVHVDRGMIAGLGLLAGALLSLVFLAILVGVFLVVAAQAAGRLRGVHF